MSGPIEEHFDLSSAGLELSNRELFEAYVDQEFELAAEPVVRKAVLSVQSAVPDSSSARAQLTEYEQGLYDRLLPKIKDVADGKLESTEFTLSCNELISSGLLKSSYTASDLGVASVLNDDKTALNQTAVNKLATLVKGDSLKVMLALLQDCPYEMYWFDKTRGSGAQVSQVKGSISNETLTMTDETLTYYFTVTGDCSKTNAINTRAVNTTKTSQAKTAAANAGAVVNANKSKNDIRKLDAYRQWICDTVDYDDPAPTTMDTDNNPYFGDPWQLISVFDNDASTRVVCEGYAKAFKRLCELSTFNNPTLTCYTSSGKMISSSGTYIEHMWNTVCINGHNYLVDLTNCDSYTDGSNKGTVGCRTEGNQLVPGTGLFMRGYTVTAPVADNATLAPTGKYMNGHRITVPQSRTNRSDAHVSYYHHVDYASVLPPNTIPLASWDCPLDEEADDALAVDARVLAIANGTETSATALNSVKAAYAALTPAQKALVQTDPNNLNTEQTESNAAAASVKSLDWGKESVLSGGAYSNVAAKPGNVAWRCADTSLKRFKVKVYKIGEGDGNGDEADAGTLVLERDVTFSSGSRSSFSCYLPQFIDFDTGSYYYTVTPKLAAGKPAPDESAISRSGVWQYTAPANTLSAPKDATLSTSVLTWTQPARTANASVPFISSYGFYVYQSSAALTDEELKAVTFSAQGEPRALHGDTDAGLALKAAKIYPTTVTSSPVSCSFNVGKFLKTRIDNGKVTYAEGAHYYLYVSTVSSDISKYRSNMHSDLMRGLSADEVAALVAKQLDGGQGDEGGVVPGGSGSDTLTAGQAADRIVSIHPAQLEIAMADADVAAKVSTLESATGVDVAVEQVAGAPAALFAGEGPSIVGATFNPLASSVTGGSSGTVATGATGAAGATGASGTAGVKLVVGAAKGTNLAVPEGYDSASAQTFSMSLEGVSDQEHLNVPVRVSLPIPAGLSTDSLAVVHYVESGSKGTTGVTPEVIVPCLEKRGGTMYASFVLKSFSDFAFVQSEQDAAREAGEGGGTTTATVDQPTTNNQLVINDPSKNDQLTTDQPSTSEQPAAGDQPPATEEQPPTVNQPTTGGQPTTSDQPPSNQTGQNTQQPMNQPATNQPETDQPAASQPAGNQPEANQPAADQPQGQPAASQPTTGQPETTQPVNNGPAANQPVDQPTAEQPPAGAQPASGEQLPNSEPEASAQPSQPSDDKPSAEQPSANDASKESASSPTTEKAPANPQVAPVASTADTPAAKAKAGAKAKKPGKVTGLKIRLAKKQMTVQWRADSSAKSYQVAWCAKGAKKWTKRTLKVTKLTVKKLKLGKCYQVRVRAKNSVGWGSWSSTMITCYLR